MPAGISSLSTLLRNDPHLVLRLLRASDAIEHPVGGGPARRIDTVIEAGGMALIQAALLDAHAGAQGMGVAAGRRHFWAHSLLTAETARELSLRSGGSDPEDAHIAGLLLDVALPLLALRSDYAPLFAQGLCERDFHAQEMSGFGLSHAEHAAALLPSGGWAGDLADALRFHHTDTALFVDAPELLRIVRAAEELSGGGAADAIQRAALAHALTGLPVEVLNDAWQTACRKVEARLSALQLSGPDMPLPNGELYGPQFETGLVEVPAAPVLLDVARNGLYAQLLDRADEPAIWRAYRLAAALLHDLPAPQVLLPVHGEARFALMDPGGDQGAMHIDLSHPGLGGIWRQLDQGIPWFGADVQAPGALPVGMQRVLRLGGDDTFAMLPMVSESGVEALALHRVPVATLAVLRRHGGALAALAGAAARALRVKRLQARDLGEQRRRMTEQYAAHARQLRADLHTPLGLMRHQVKSMRLKMGADSMLESELSVFDDQVARIDTVLRQFESRPPDVAAAAQWTDINQLLEQIVADADEHQLRARSITTELHLDAALPPLRLPLAVMRDILGAVLLASADQIGNSGRIAISSADGVNWNGDLFAEIRMRDFGRGMDSARVAALFSSQSADGSNRHSLVEALAHARALGGSLSCKSAVGQGTVFQLLLPRLTRRKVQDVPAALQD